MKLVMISYRLGEKFGGLGETTGCPKVCVPTLILVFSGLFPALARAKNGENHRFLTVLQLLRLLTSTHPNEIQIICGHTLVRLPCKISAGPAHWELSNQLWRADTCVILGRTEPLFQPSKHPNLNCFQPFSKIYIRSL